MKDHEKLAQIITQFLIAPNTKSAFDPFFQLSHQICKRYLAHLKRRGFILSDSHITDEHSPENLTYDILGYFMASKSDQPFYIIFRYFERQGITDFEKTDPLIVFDHYLRLLKGFIHQQLTKLNRQEYPQKENLKRRFKEILNEKEYDELSDNNIVYLFLKNQEDNLRTDKPYIEFDLLEQIILDAFNQTHNRREWCGLIFQILSEQDEFKNKIKKYDLLALVLKINYQFLYDPDNYHTKSKSIEDSVLQQAVQNAIEYTLVTIQQNCINTFVEKNRITADEGKTLFTATEHLLKDFGASSDNDSFPIYFLELSPTVSQTEYQKKYKYVCDTVFNKALDIFKDRLGNDSTI